jgi:phosphoribosylformimino-5-aminoimidazole carboxamide ribotide isomerase
MLIPSIDLQGGRIVQLVQGQKLALEATNTELWIQRFKKFPKVQLIDLDAAMGTGSNLNLAKTISRRLPCRMGGGIRTVDRAIDVLTSGAQEIIVGSSLFRNGHVDVSFAQTLATAVGPDRIIAAVDSRDGYVVIHGWKTKLEIKAVDAVKELEPFCTEFLYTHVDLEGLMQGTDLDAVRAVNHATQRKVTAAGGITTQTEIDQLDAEGIDAVVGMAVYTGTLALPDQTQ